jgi:hypothetical protein
MIRGAASDHKRFADARTSTTNVGMIQSGSRLRGRSMSTPSRGKVRLTTVLVLLGSIFARPGGGGPPAPIFVSPARAAAHAPEPLRSQSVATDPEPWFSITWTARADGSSDVTDPDGTHTVTVRHVEMSASSIVRRYSDGTQDSFSYDITLNDDYDRVRTIPCLDVPGVDRDHERQYVVDSGRYQGMDHSIGSPLFPPQQRQDGSWYLLDPLAGAAIRFYTYATDSEHLSCYGDRNTDHQEYELGNGSVLFKPGDIDGDSEGVTFQKEISFTSPFSIDPPLDVHWSVTARRIADRDLTVEQLEVTQGLQSMSNSIPLVRGRRTVVRAYLGVGKQEAPVLAVTGILRGWSGSTPLGATSPFNPGREIDVPRTPLWRNINDTLNFEVPFPWTLAPSLRLEVEVNPEHLALEDNYNNNKLDTTVTLTSCQPIKIDYLPIHYAPPAGNPSDPTIGIHEGQGFLRKVYPVAEGDLFYWLETGFTFSEDVTDGAGPVGARLVDLVTQRLLTSSLPRPDRLVGWLPAHASTTANGRADMPGVGGWVVENTNPNTWRASFAHEVGHTYGQGHTDLTTGGRHWFDVSERKIQPPSTGTDLYDFIFGVGQPEPERWAAPETYNFLFGKICGGAVAQTLEARAATVGDNMLLSGIVNNVVPPTGSLDPIFRTTTAPTFIPDPPIAGPGYCVKLKDGAGTLLAQYCFDINFVVESSTGSPAGASSFGLVVPYPVGLARVELTRATSTLHFRTPSAHAPSVTLTYPSAAGLTLSGPQTVTWNANDSDGNPLTYSLHYSRDNGVTWRGLASGLTATSYPLDASQLPGTVIGRIRVQASDGFLTAQDDSDNSFAVGKKAPIVQIASPPPGQMFDALVPVTLEAAGTDLEDGSLPDGAFSWSSDRDGSLGTGRLIEHLLSVGSHVITLTGTDTDGQTATATVMLTVSGTPPPAPGFYTVTPCRVADTRDPAGPWGGPALGAGTPRTFAIGSRCGIPTNAKAVSFNFIVTQPTALGHITVYPAGSNPPNVSAMNYKAGQTRANNAIVAVGPGAQLNVVSGQSSGTVQLIIDVNGYFQ